jgi:putative PIG3 family NAD(P)H quinone oxidoreductase
MNKARAVRIREPGGPEVLELVDVEVRAPGPGEVLVEVAAAGLNRADVLQRRGRYPAPPGAPADIPGLEYSGHIIKVGEGVDGARVGERVMGIVGGGGMSTHLVVHGRETIPVPANVELVDAAAIPEVFVTSWDALFLQAGLGLGETALVHAVGSGIGTAALQLANAAGARVIGTSRSQLKLERCREYGLVDGLACAGPSFADDVRRLSPRGADVVLDTVGAPYFDENVKALATKGRMVLVGTLGGAAAQVSLGAWMAKRATVMGTVLRARPLEEKIALAQGFARSVVPLFAGGRLRPVIDAVLPMSDVSHAHARMERDETFGKLVLSW